MKRTRNFWLHGRVDGRKTPVEAGPASRDGGFTETVYIRGENGTAVTAVRIEGRVFPGDELRLSVEPGESPFRTEDGKILPDSVSMELLANGGFILRSRR